MKLVYTVADRTGSKVVGAPSVECRYTFLPGYLLSSFLGFSADWVSVDSPPLQATKVAKHIAIKNSFKYLCIAFL
jgi:hypothetical protein